MKHDRILQLYSPPFPTKLVVFVTSNLRKKDPIYHGHDMTYWKAKLLNHEYYGITLWYEFAIA